MIKENILRVKERIASSCARINADPGKIILLCVTKGRSLEEIQEALEAGIEQLGENRLQEALKKYALIPRAHWQMIGHLQTNKVKDAVKIFDLIHSVDSVSLAWEIDKQALRINKIQDILLEVKTSPEETKSGFAPEALAQASQEISKFSQVRVKGLMTVPALGQGQESARPYFSRLRQLRDKLNPAWLLSMGMSDDFEAAIEEGSDIIRLGRAIFE